MLAFALGTASASASFGAFAVWKDESLQTVMLVLALGVCGGGPWAALIAAGVSLRRWPAGLLLAAACLVAGFPKLLVLSLGMTDLRPSLEPRAGQHIALLCDAGLLLSFAPVLHLARRLHRGDARRTPLDLALSASAWLVAVALAGVVVAPSLALRLICATVFLAGSLALIRCGAQARSEAGEGRALGRRVGEDMLLGAILAGIGGVGVAVARLPELHVSPVVAKIYEQRSDCVPCRIRPAAGGRPGLSLWCIDCTGAPAHCEGWGSAWGPRRVCEVGSPVGWDEQAGKTIGGKELKERLEMP